MKIIRTYWKLLLLSCICAVLGNAFSEAVIAILLPTLFPEEARLALSVLDIMQKFGHATLNTPIFLILTTMAGFSLLAMSLRKHLQAMPLATIVWGSLIGIYLSIVRFIAMTDAIGKIFSYVLPIESDVNSLNFIFFILVIPFALLAIIVIAFKFVAQSQKTYISPAMP
ncbi:hypothetical protein [Undibacterium sp. TC9W]|uniref:hypothetical protein n=1 Tax=Undibacterium sp. TC9W TaxID=3413053 RepID=UPI003BF3782B